MYRSILVPLDGSAFGEHALPLALTIAQQAGAKVQLALVHRPVTPMTIGGELVGDPTLDATVRDRETVYLDVIAKKLAGVSPVKAGTAMLDGPVAQALQEYAASAGSDLVILTTHGRGALSRLWLGSVADQLMRRLPIPVLLVRPQDGPPDLTGKPALKHVLIPLDGSELAEQILEPAIALGSVTGADYTLLSVVEPLVLPDGQFGINVMGTVDPVLLQELHAQAQRYLDQVAARLRARSLSVQSRLVINQPPALAILEEARANAIDVIALATHGRGGLTRLLLGSVADKVVRGGSTAVLVQRPHGK